MWSDACNLQLSVGFLFQKISTLWNIWQTILYMDENNVILSVSSHFPIKNIVNYNFRYFTCINYKDSSISRSCNLMKPLNWDYLTNLEHTLIGVTSNSLFCIHEVFKLYKLSLVSVIIFTSTFPLYITLSAKKPDSEPFYVNWYMFTCISVCIILIKHNSS